MRSLATNCEGNAMLEYWIVGLLSALLLGYLLFALLRPERF